TTRDRSAQARPCPPRLAPDDPARESPPLPVPNLRTRLAGRPHRSCCTTGEAVAARGAVGTEMPRDRQDVDQSYRCRPRCLVAHRQLRDPGHRPATPPRCPRQVRRCPDPRWIAPGVVEGLI